MSTISVYYTDDGDGTEESGPWATYTEARSEAFAHAGRVIEYEFSDSSVVDDFAPDPVEDVATDLWMHWNVPHDDALAAARTFADNGGDGSGMTFAEQVAENTAYVVAEYMIDGEYVATVDRRRCRHCAEWFAFEEDETQGGLCRGCDATLPVDHPNRGENR